MAKKSKKTATDKVTKGDAHGKDVFQQTKDARKLDDPKKDDGGAGKTGAEVYLYTDEKKAADAYIESRKKHLEDLGLDPDSPEASRVGLIRGEKADKRRKLFQGPVTMTGVSFHNNEKISIRSDLATPMTEEGAFHVFRQHHPSALREDFKIDPENKDDPNLRTSLE